MNATLLSSNDNPYLIQIRTWVRRWLAQRLVRGSVRSVIRLQTVFRLGSSGGGAVSSGCEFLYQRDLNPNGPHYREAPPQAYRSLSDTVIAAVKAAKYDLTHQSAAAQGLRLGNISGATSKQRRRCSEL